MLAALVVVGFTAAGACSPGDSESGEGDDSEEASRPQFDVVDTSSAANAEEAAQMWIDQEFQESTLTPEQQMDEMRWFAEAARPYEGMEINVVSETITTHEYESQVLAQAFEDVTGIHVNHDLIAEGDVIEKLQTQVQSGENIYDGYVNDSDLIGTHWRNGDVLPLSDYIEGDGAEITNPGLDLDDFIGLSFTTAPDGKVYQLPDQQFANLYWFRYDWFTDPEIQRQFREIYGYDLGVPVNWAAYEDIANFFTNEVNGNGTIDGERVYGHMDYGKRDPSLGWRFTDAWLSMAGNGDSTGDRPNGYPVDEWGIRVEDCRPVGSSVSRGGDVNGPAAVYALQKYLDWLQDYAPPQAAGMTFSEAGPVPAQGHVAQQVFWYTAFTADMTQEGLPVVNEDGTPRWRMAPSPHGAYWHDGQKLGYQDAGSWTFLQSTPDERRDAAWLYAQFVTSKTVSLTKSIKGLTFIRESDVNSDYFTENADRYGGLIEFYRSPAREQWTPTGTNVPDYPKLAQLWWENIAPAVTGESSAQEAMDNLAEAQDEILGRLERAGVGGECGPRLNEERDPEYWLEQPGAPVPRLEDERGEPQTIPYDELIAQWEATGCPPHHRLASGLTPARLDPTVRPGRRPRPDMRRRPDGPARPDMPARLDGPAAPDSPARAARRLHRGRQARLLQPDGTGLLHRPAATIGRRGHGIWPGRRAAGVGVDRDGGGSCHRGARCW